MTSKRQIITLTSDWGSGEFYNAIVKGRIYTGIDNVEVVDICHSINKFDPVQAAFIIEHCCKTFPAGTIHLIDIGCADAAALMDYIIVESGDQYYLGCNNGMLSLALHNDYQRAYQITSPADVSINSFTFLSLAVPVAIRIAQGEDCAAIATPIEQIKQGNTFQPALSRNLLTLHIIYIDSYGNAFLDITIDEFRRLCDGHTFTFEANGYKITEITPYYPPLTQRSIHVNPIVVPSASTGLLEIAIPMGSAAQLLGLRVNHSINVTLH